MEDNMHRGTTSGRLSVTHENASAQPRDAYRVEYVYLVGVHDCEGSSVHFICASEETARIKFTELLRKTILEYKRIHGIYQSSDRAHLDFLEAQTFDQQIPEGLRTYHERPYWAKFVVLP